MPLSPIMGPTRRMTAPLIIDFQLDHFMHTGLSQQIEFLEPDTPIRPPFPGKLQELTGTQPVFEVPDPVHKKMSLQTNYEGPSALQPRKMKTEAPPMNQFVTVNVQNQNINYNSQTTITPGSVRVDRGMQTDPPVPGTCCQTCTQMIPANFDFRNTADGYTESQLADNESNVAEAGSNIFNVTQYDPATGQIKNLTQSSSNRRTIKVERKSEAKLSKYSLAQTGKPDP